MNRPDDRDPALARLLGDAVSEVEPDDRLSDIRARTATPTRRPWLLATGGAVLAAAAVVTAVALVGNDRPAADDPDPALPPTSETTPTDDQSTTDASPTTSSTVGVYYLGDTPAGPRLYREFRQGAGEPLAASLDLLGTAPDDPDYRTVWEPGQLLDASFDGAGDDGLITVEVDPVARQLPPGTSPEEAATAVQQVVYTLQGAVQARADVQFMVDGEPADQVLGVETGEPLTQAPALDVLAWVNLTNPAEGQVLGSTLAVEGQASSFEANVPWRLESGDQVVQQGFFTAAGWMGPRLFPFSGDIDVSSLDPGTYTLIVETDDPSGGLEGTGAFSDTRTVVIE